jgi:hypothetical protein
MRPLLNHFYSGNVSLWTHAKHPHLEVIRSLERRNGEGARAAIVLDITEARSRSWQSCARASLSRRRSSSELQGIKRPIGGEAGTGTSRAELKSDR